VWFFLPRIRILVARFDDFRRVVEQLKTDFKITEEEAVARLQAVKGKLRHAYLICLDGQAWGGQGGTKYDDFRRVVEQLKTHFKITEEEAVARLQAVKGNLRHAYLVLMDARAKGGQENSKVATAERIARMDELDELLAASLTSSDPTWSLQVWYDDVKASTGASKRHPQGLAEHRAQKFKVGSRGDFLKLNEKIRGLTLPELPPRNATVQAKDTWRTDCARLKFAYIEKSEMIHTFVYYKYQEQKLNASVRTP
jgi:hypothetical protein